MRTLINNRLMVAYICSTSVVYVQRKILKHPRSLFHTLWCDVVLCSYFSHIENTHSQPNLLVHFLILNHFLPLSLYCFLQNKGIQLFYSHSAFYGRRRILVVKFKCCVWTAVCFLCTWMQASCTSTFYLLKRGSKKTNVITTYLSTKYI